VNIAINSEASVIIFTDGWYYLLVTHGSCCAGANSSYNIRMGRSRKMTGPYLDNMGIDMLQGGGKLFLGSSGRHIGRDISVCSTSATACRSSPATYEADLDRGGSSVLDIRPLLWRDGWPSPARTSRKARIEIESAERAPRSNSRCRVCQSADARGRGGRGGGGGGGECGGRASGRAADTRAGRRLQVSASWPAGPSDARLSPYMVQAQQKWTIAPWRTRAGIPGRRTSASASPEPIAHWRRREDRELSRA
jgi:arabinan endo-1,5-alpha-L-arabinosidase